jgi:acetyltransferase
VVVLTTAGGWGVVTADAISRDGTLSLLELPDDLRTAIDALLPPRWSRNNPVDCAGGETRDTIPTVLQLLVDHPDVDAVIYLGLGIQSNQARMMREGGFYPAHGLKRIVDYHERQDRRFAEAAAELSDRSGKPILCATELAVADPANPGPAAVRATGRLAYPSGERAVAALGHLYRYARHRARRAG